MVNRWAIGGLQLREAAERTGHVNGVHVGEGIHDVAHDIAGRQELRRVGELRHSRDAFGQRTAVHEPQRLRGGAHEALKAIGETKSHCHDSGHSLKMERGKIREGVELTRERRGKGRTTLSRFPGKREDNCTTATLKDGAVGAMRRVFGRRHDTQLCLHVLRGSLEVF